MKKHIVCLYLLLTTSKMYPMKSSHITNLERRQLYGYVMQLSRKNNTRDLLRAQNELSILLKAVDPTSNEAGRYRRKKEEVEQKMGTLSKPHQPNKASEREGHREVKKVALTVATTSKLQTGGQEVPEQSDDWIIINEQDTSPTSPVLSTEWVVVAGRLHELCPI